MTRRWSPMLVIRPDAGRARIEDSQLRITESENPEALARKIAAGSEVVGSRAIGDDSEYLNPARLDWISKGWRPSLEYFDWSEDSEKTPEVYHPAPARRVFARRPGLPADATSAVWHWGELADMAAASDRTVGEILIGRKTLREYDAKRLDQRELARILHDFAELLDGSRRSDGFLAGLRFAMIVYAADGLAPGVWNLDLDAGLAWLVQAGDLRRAMSDLMCGMQAPMTANVTVVFVADLQERQQLFPYERALRELYVEAGRVAQWLILACESREAGCLITPATNDRVLSELLGLPPREVPVYTVTFGHRAQVPSVPSAP